MSLNGHSSLSPDNVHVNGEHVLLIAAREAGAFPEPGICQDAPGKSREEKIRVIAGHFREIMRTLGLDLEDESLAGTPNRVARMYVKELFSGLDARNKPRITLFENKFGYDQMLVEKDIRFYSTCEHHFVPIIGKAHVAYFSSGKLIGLSKMHRLVRYIASRPQVQERLTVEIARELSGVLDTKDVAVMLEASHLCVAARGIKDPGSRTVTSWYGGRFKREDIKNAFISSINR